MEKHNLHQDDRTGDRDHDSDNRSGQRPQRNPRLVFSDPDLFFNDLLMEQQEQG